jgi:hypothetical protein
MRLSSCLPKVLVDGYCLASYFYAQNVGSHETEMKRIVVQ